MLLVLNSGLPALIDYLLRLFLKFLCTFPQDVLSVLKKLCMHLQKHLNDPLKNCPPLGQFAKMIITLVNCDCFFMLDRPISLSAYLLFIAMCCFCTLSL